MCRPSACTRTRCLACITTSRFCSLHGTNGRWREGADTHFSSASASTAFHAAAACSRRPGIKREHRRELALRARLYAPLTRLRYDIVFVPPQLCRRPPQCSPVELPSPQEHCRPRRACHGYASVGVRAVSDRAPCPRLHRLQPSTIVGTCGTSTSASRALFLSAATAASASRIHAITADSSYTRGSKSWWIIAMSPSG
eukprot:5396802-Pleurochrysis_carterae.AAC.3